MNKSPPPDKLIKVAQLLPRSDGWRQRRPTPSQRPIHLAGFLSACRPEASLRLRRRLFPVSVLSHRDALVFFALGLFPSRPRNLFPDVFLYDAGISIGASPALGVGELLGRRRGHARGKWSVHHGRSQTVCVLCSRECTSMDRGEVVETLGETPARENLGEEPREHCCAATWLFSCLKNGKKYAKYLEKPTQFGP